MRCFTALELPDPVRAHLSGVIDRLRIIPSLKDSVSWVKPENLHITLKFLNDIPDDRVGDLANAFRRLPLAPMTLTLDHFLVLPGQGPARVLAANVAGDVKPLVHLFGQIEAASQPLGVRREGRAFKPHVTLGRFRRPSNRMTAATLIRIVNPALLPSPTFTAASFTLFQSTLTPSGPIYAPLAHIGPSPTPGPARTPAPEGRQE
jgi:2'-5' RNA ligase